MSNVKRQLLANKLKELRGNRTVYQLAKETGIDRSLLSRYEKGTLPENAMLKRLATFYEIPFESLKGLVFEELYPIQSDERTLLFNWVEAKLKEKE